MKNLVVLGLGTAGTIVANRMARLLSSKEWTVTAVDPETTHLYQPGLLFLPFGAHDEEKMQRTRNTTLDMRVEWRQEGVSNVDPVTKRVTLKDGGVIDYDLLVIASGSRVRPELTEGLVEGWGREHFGFYTLPDAQALREKLATWPGGRLVLNITEMPIKCPVAPLEFLFLADDFFGKRGIRDDVELVLATPLDSPFTKPVAAEHLGYLMKEKNILLETEFMTASADGKVLTSYDERTVPYDLLVSVPTHSGAEFVETSGLGDELSFIPTHNNTLASKEHPDVFILGDATDLPASKAGSVAHFQAEVLAENLLRASRGEDVEAGFDGHANCFIETGHGKAMLIDFNYEVEPLPGHYPTSLGPFTLLEESRTNHMGKLFFRWLYWNALLPAKPLPIGARMSMTGKDREAAHPAH